MTAWTAVGDVGNQLLFFAGFCLGFGVRSLVSVVMGRFTAKERG